MKMAWRDLFIYSFIEPPPPPYQNVLQERRGWTYPSENTHCQTLSFQSTSMIASFPCALPVFHRSFSFVIHKSTKCPFQDAHKHHHRFSKMPRHSEARAADGGEPTVVCLAAVGEVMNVRVNVYISSLPGKANGFWVEMSNRTVKVLIKWGKCKCHVLAFPNIL